MAGTEELVTISVGPDGSAVLFGNQREPPALHEQGAVILDVQEGIGDVFYVLLRTVDGVSAWQVRPDE